MFVVGEAFGQGVPSITMALSWRCPGLVRSQKSAGPVADLRAPKATARRCGRGQAPADQTGLDIVWPEFAPVAPGLPLLLPEHRRGFAVQANLLERRLAQSLATSLNDAVRVEVVVAVHLKIPTRSPLHRT